MVGAADLVALAIEYARLIDAKPGLDGPPWNRVALRTDRGKLYYTPTRDGVRWSLHDLVADPDELRDVAAQHADVLPGLQAELLRWMAERRQLEGASVVTHHLYRKADEIDDHLVKLSVPPVVWDGGEGAS